MACDAAYLREIEHARRDACELRDLLVDELTLHQLMEAIGLATMARVSLTRAVQMRAIAAEARDPQDRSDSVGRAIAREIYPDVQ
ncbi:MAG TPA: hypothetical protein DD732_07445 [Rhizobiales bacterium]|jgi:hypothetical protein|nr:hypothetical protein [Hyphomicrobiales bacterium]